jgi:WD repeat-containing protein 6
MDLAYSRCPVTALSFYRSQSGQIYVLAGEDGVLKFFDVATRGLCASLRLLEGQAIHGISTSGFTEETETAPHANVLIWGGHFAAFISRNRLESALAGGAAARPGVAQAQDRILDGLLPHYSGQYGVLITAHNEVITYSRDQHTGYLELNKAVSLVRLLLFSAKAAWLDNGSVLVAAGTAFGEIIIWRVALLDTEGNGIKVVPTILAQLTGHEGSIFGVDVSANIVLPSGRRTRLVASCSDDRTIRIWDIGHLVEEEEAAWKASAGVQSGGMVVGGIEDARETGFQRHADRSLGSRMKPVATASGHASRIWHVKFARSKHQSSNQAGQLTMYSFGEDATAQEWDLQLDDTTAAEPLRGMLTHTGTISSHSGRHIWGAAVFGEAPLGCLVATGGADGGIWLQRRAEGLPAANKGIGRDTLDVEQSRHNQLTDALLSFSPADIQSRLLAPSDPDVAQAGDLPNAANFSSKDTVQRYHFLTSDRFLASTASGKLLLAEFGKDSLTWSQVGLPRPLQEDLSSYSVMGGSGDGELYIGTASGTVYAYELQLGLRVCAKLEGKISGIFQLGRQTEATVPSGQGNMGAVFENSDSDRTRSRELLVTMLGRQDATLIHLEPNMVDENAKTSVLELDEHVAVTAANRWDNYIVLGFRTGWLTVFQDVDGQMKKVLSVKATSKKDAVTCILPLESNSRQPSDRFVATSRDGMYRIYTMNKLRRGLELCLIHEVQAAFGPTIEGAWLIDSPDTKSNELVLCGFSGKAFKVWNETRRHEIGSVDCGGGHRSFAYILLQGRPEGFRFVFTKASTLNLYSQEYAKSVMLQDGGHGREIRAVATNGDLIATGAEDTTIRISRLIQSAEGVDSGTSELECLAVLDKHTTGLQCLTWCGPNHMISGSGNEELFMWRTAPLESRLRGLAVICEAACPPITPERDLRIMSIDAEQMNDAAGVGMLISVALSDSTLRTYEYCGVERKRFRLLAQGRYTGACLTQIRQLRMSSGRYHVAAAATDGYLTIWTADVQEGENGDAEPMRYTLSLATSLHRNSIKALDLVFHKGARDSWVFLTGGDDNALGILTIALDVGTEKFSVADKHRISRAHAAAITGIQVVAAQEFSVELVTVSCDQRVRQWKVEYDIGTVRKISLIEDRYSSVADAGDLSLIRSKQVVVVGIGTEIWRLQDIT